METSESLYSTPDISPEYPVGTRFQNGDQLNLHMTSEAVNSERARALTDAARHAESVEDFYGKQPEIASAQPEKIPAKHELIAEDSLVVFRYRRDELDLAA